VKIISETNFETGGKNKNRFRPKANRAGPLPRKPEQAGPTGRNRAGAFLKKFELTGGALSSGHLSDRTGTPPLDSNPTARRRRFHRARAGTHRRRQGRGRRRRETYGRKSLTARGGKGSGGASPLLPAVHSSNGGRTRWRHPRQKLAGVDGYGERERTEEGEVVWEVAEDGVGSMACSEGGFIGRSGLERGVSRRWPVQVSGDVQWSMSGAAALGACWRGEVMASGHCGHALASSRRSVACREAEGKGEGSGPFSSLSPESLGRGPGR
jgi:hypothetical protein